MLTGRKDPALGRGEVSFMERETSCCFTGHRRISPQDGLWLRRMLRQEILRMAQEGVRSFLAGGALGFDTMAAQEVLRMRAEYLPDLELVLVLPCVGQEEKWRQRDAAVYRALLRQADQVVYMGQGYTKSKTFTFDRADGRPDAKTQTYWTQKGRLWLNEVLNKRGIFAIMDRKSAS